ncbi:MAG TPA: hypothetical protein VE944_07140 [Nostoc sp.]|nr:hypothetical protein [Nostoc sp.]
MVILREKLAGVTFHWMWKAAIARKILTRVYRSLRKLPKSQEVGLLQIQKSV